MGWRECRIINNRHYSLSHSSHCIEEVYLHTFYYSILVATQIWNQLCYGNVWECLLLAPKRRKLGTFKPRPVRSRSLVVILWIILRSSYLLAWVDGEGWGGIKWEKERGWERTPLLSHCSSLSHQNGIFRVYFYMYSWNIPEYTRLYIEYSWLHRFSHC